MLSGCFSWPRLLAELLAAGNELNSAKATLHTDAYKISSLVKFAGEAD